MLVNGDYTSYETSSSSKGFNFESSSEKLWVFLTISWFLDRGIKLWSVGV